MSQPQHTLFLWARGAFPRRIAYQLLHKKLVSSAEALLTGETVVQNLDLKIATLGITEGVPGFTESDPSDPKPDGKAWPALRIRYNDGTERWIHESTSIALYIEETFPGPAAISKDPISRAQAVDGLSMANIAMCDASYYIRNATAVTEFWSGLADADRSLGGARNAFASANKCLVRLQDWNATSLDEGGWLTPDVEDGAPGVADFALAAQVRYMELVYSFDVLRDERLGQLREWYGRFKKIDWWAGFEETGAVQPPELAYPKDIWEA